MVESRATRILLRAGALLTLAFIYLPLVVVALYAFNRNITQGVADRELQHEVVLRRVRRSRRA